MASQDIRLSAKTAPRLTFLRSEISRYLFQPCFCACYSHSSTGSSTTRLPICRRANIASGFGFLRAVGLRYQQQPDRLFDRIRPLARLDRRHPQHPDGCVVGIITATIIGFIVGIGRLSHNWLIRKICTVYVEVFRNIPPLLVIFFWYFGVLSVLPQARESIKLPFSTYLNNRGFFFPARSWVKAPGWPVALSLHGMTWFLVRRAHQRQMATGQQFPVVLTALGLIVGFPLLGFHGGVFRYHSTFRFAPSI